MLQEISYKYTLEKALIFIHLTGNLHNGKSYTSNLV